MRRRLNWFVVAAFVGTLPLLAQSQSLRETASRSQRLIGAAARASQLSESLYSATLSREFNLLEPENELKWQAIHPTRDGFDFLPGDQLITFAKMHAMKVRGHTLVWGRYLPPWLADGHFTPEQLRQILQEHITTVVSHYRGQVFAWDVVNEAFDEFGQLRSSIWYDRPGIGAAADSTAYIEQAFQWAHAADPAALLFYNEAEAEALGRKSDAIYAMVKDFKHRRVPIDGIGMQMHILDLHPDVDSIAANIRRFTALGVEVHITEMDVAIPVDAEGRPRQLADLARQAEIYRQIAVACFVQAGCTALQTWGFTDKYSWIRSASKGTKGAALPFDRVYVPKAAYASLHEALRQPPQP